MVFFVVVVVVVVVVFCLAAYIVSFDNMRASLQINSNNQQIITIGAIVTFYLGGNHQMSNWTAHSMR